MSHHASDIRLGAGTASQWIAESELYFSFLSGTFQYDCASCGAKCCRGFGYSTPVGPTLDRLLLDRPALRLFLEPTGDSPPTRYHTANCAPGCFFLNTRGLCDIHSNHGHAAKPETCRLFPFNHFRRLGPYLLVGPHISLCPLQVTAQGTASELSNHAGLTEEMRSQGITGPIPRCNSIWGDPDKAIALERALSDLARSHPVPHYPDFVVSQLALCDQHLNGDLAGTPEGKAKRQMAVQRFVTACYQVLDVAPSTRDTCDLDLSHIFTVLTPVLRAMLVFRDEGSEGIGFDRLIGIDRIPFYLLATFVLASCAKRAGMQTITYQSICQMFQTFQPLLRLLASVDQRVRWRRHTLISLPSLENQSLKPHFLRIARSLLPSEQKRHPITLGDLLCNHMPHGKVDRVIFLKQIATTAATHLERLDVAGVDPGRASIGRRGRAFAQRLVLGGAPENVLVAAYDRMFWSLKPEQRPMRA